MKKILNIKEYCGSELRTRQMVEHLAQTLQNDIDYLFDMSGVEQISRSAADELYTITHERHIEVINKTPFVQKMLDAVILGRFQPREKSVSETPIIHCTTMSSLSQCLMAK